MGKIKYNGSVGYAHSGVLKQTKIYVFKTNDIDDVYSSLSPYFSTSVKMTYADVVNVDDVYNKFVAELNEKLKDKELHTEGSSLWGITNAVASSSLKIASEQKLQTYKNKKDNSETGSENNSVDLNEKTTETKKTVGKRKTKTVETAETVEDVVQSETEVNENEDEEETKDVEQSETEEVVETVTVQKQTKLKSVAKKNTVNVTDDEDNNDNNDNDDNNDDTEQQDEPVQITKSKQTTTKSKATKKEDVKLVVSEPKTKTVVKTKANKK